MSDASHGLMQLIQPDWSRYYRRGGLVAPAPRRSSGFGDAEFVEGAVRGYRWWSLPAPPVHLSPVPAVTAAWKPGLLRGMRDIWLPGVNTAACKAGVPPAYLSSHPGETIPDERCGCGFWAYWTIRHHELDLKSRSVPVAGVIEGFGQVLIGDHGFRAQKARIVALHLPFRFEPDLPRQPDSQLALDRGRQHEYGPHNPWYNHPKFTGRVYRINTAPPPVPPPGPPEPEPAEEEIAEARDRAEAWTAVTGDYLDCAYPDAEVFETLALMTAKYPPDPQRLPEQSRCPFCEGWFTDIQGHYASCVTNKYAL